MNDESTDEPDQHQDEISDLLLLLKAEKQRVPPDEHAIIKIGEQIATRALGTDNRLTRRAYRELGDSELAHDAAVEAVIRILDKPEKFTEGRSGWAWMFGYLRYTILEFRRITLRNPKLQGDSERSYQEFPCNQTEKTAQVDIEGILRGLKGIQRKVIELELDGLDNAEIAAELGLSLANVKVIKHRAKAALRRLLAKDIAA